LHVAACNGYLEVVKILLAYGANPYDKNNVSSVIFVCVLYDVVCIVVL